MPLPIKLSPKSEALPLVLIILSAFASFYFYFNFPSQVPTHWNFKGQVDSYSGKAFAAFFFPILIAVMYLLFLVLPCIDPKKERYREFTKTYHLFKNVLVLFMVALYALTGLVGLGYNIRIDLAVPWSVGLLFIVLGIYMPKIKPNWFMGIRTPWTLSSEKVWAKTHKAGGKLFVLVGLIFLIMPFLGERLIFPVIIITILIFVLGTIVYSYLLYRQEEKKK